MNGIGAVPPIVDDSEMQSLLPRPGEQVTTQTEAGTEDAAVYGTVAALLMTAGGAVLPFRLPVTPTTAPCAATISTPRRAVTKGMSARSCTTRRRSARSPERRRKRQLSTQTLPRRTWRVLLCRIHNYGHRTCYELCCWHLRLI